MQAFFSLLAPEREPGTCSAPVGVGLALQLISPWCFEVPVVKRLPESDDALLLLERAPAGPAWCSATWRRAGPVSAERSTFVLASAHLPLVRYQCADCAPFPGAFCRRLCAPFDLLESGCVGRVGVCPGATSSSHGGRAVVQPAYLHGCRAAIVRLMAAGCLDRGNGAVLYAAVGPTCQLRWRICSSRRSCPRRRAGHRVPDGARRRVYGRPIERPRRPRAHGRAHTRPLEAAASQHIVRCGLFVRCRARHLISRLHAAGGTGLAWLLWPARRIPWSEAKVAERCSPRPSS